MNPDYDIEEHDIPDLAQAVALEAPRLKGKLNEETLKLKFGQLMTRFAIVQSIIKDYDDESKHIQKEIDDLMKGVIDGKSVQ